MIFRIYQALLFFQSLRIVVASPASPNQQPLWKQQSNDASFFTSEFDTFVEDTLNEFHVPGISVAIIDDDNALFKGYGIANLPDEEVTPDTLFFTGSTSKAFTAAAVAQLVHDDNAYSDMKWTSPIINYLREDFVLEDEHTTTHTTIEDALSHRTGMPRHDLIYGQVNDTPSSIVKRMRYLPMTYEPRTNYQYCNLMFVLMTDFLETVTGYKLENLLHDKIWKPLGMASTSYTIPSNAKGRKPPLARGYYWDPTSKDSNSASSVGEYVPEPYIDLLPISGAGATISNVQDYSLWIKALLDAGDLNKPVNDSSPITRAMFHDVVTPRTIAAELVSEDVVDSKDYMSPPLYALGWFKMEISGETIISHSGGLTGFGTEVYMIPRLNFGVVTMGNTAGTSNTAGSTIATRLMLKKVGKDDKDESLTTKTLSTLQSLSSMTLPPKALLPNNPTPRPPQRSTSLPLPGKISNFVGLYSHPAYGIINLTATSDTTLTAYIAPRTWPTKLTLTHTTDTVFTMDHYQPHGLGSIDPEGWGHPDSTSATESKIVWEKIVEGRQGVFKFGLDGENVETMGLELEARMVDVARAKGERAWMEGMIWFERL